MAVLDSKIQDKIDSLVDDAYVEFSKGNREKSFIMLNKAWELFPKPREQWNEAYNIAKYTVDDYLKIDDINNASVWLKKMILNNDNLHLSDEECSYYEAKIFFEKKMFNEAYEKFKFVVNEAGYRYFEDEDPKYLDFYKNPKKYIKE